MCERMLNKSQKPELEEMTAFCGETAELFTSLNGWLNDVCATVSETVFPYGNNYGWGIAHKKNKKLICNIFPERGTFTVMLRLSDERFAAVYNEVGKRAKEYIDGKYPCGGGGWIHYRVENADDLADVKTLLCEKCR